MVKQMEKKTTSNNKLPPSYPTIYFHRMNLWPPEPFSANFEDPPHHPQILLLPSLFNQPFVLPPSLPTPFHCHEKEELHGNYPYE